MQELKNSISKRVEQIGSKMQKDYTTRLKNIQIFDSIVVRRFSFRMFKELIELGLNAKGDRKDKLITVINAIESGTQSALENGVIELNGVTEIPFQLFSDLSKFQKIIQEGDNMAFSAAIVILNDKPIRHDEAPVKELFKNLGSLKEALGLECNSST